MLGKDIVKLINEELITISGEHNNRHILLSEKGLDALHNIEKTKNLSNQEKKKN